MVRSHAIVARERMLEGMRSTVLSNGTTHVLLPAQGLRNICRNVNSPTDLVLWDCDFPVAKIKQQFVEPRSMVFLVCRAPDRGMQNSTGSDREKRFEY
jgi:hypothetical protein